MCSRYVQITSSVPEKYHVLVMPFMMRINQALEPGFYLHNWNSITTMNYVNVSMENVQILRITKLEHLFGI